MEGDAAERIRGQLLDINGYASGPRLTVAVTSVGPMHAPRVAYSAASHTYLVTWIERNGQQSVETYCLGTQCVTDYFYKNDLYVMPLAADGAPLAATPIRLTREVTEFGYSETAFDVVSNSQQNEFLVEWMQPRGAIFLMPNGNFVLQPNRVLAQRVSPDGTLLGGQVLMLIGAYHLYHTVYSPVSNEYLMTLDLWHGGSDGYEVYAQRYQADTLTARGGKADLSLRAAGDQTWTSVAYDPDLERYLVVWLDEAANPRRVRDILMKAGTGALLSAVGQVSNSTDGANIFYPFVAYSPVEQQYLVVMGTANGLEGRNVANSGAPVGTPAFAIGPVSFPGGVAARAGGDPNAAHYVTVWERNGDIFSGSIPYVAPPTPTPTATPTLVAPPFSTSRYIVLDDGSGQIDVNTYEEQGCKEAIDEGAKNLKFAIVILDFGYPYAYTDGTTNQPVYGARPLLNSAIYIPTATIKAAIQRYLQGFRKCYRTGTHLILAIGTNNWPLEPNKVVGTNPGEQYTLHGKAWGSMVQEIRDWIFLQPCSGPAVPCLYGIASVGGAIDIEDWSSALTADDSGRKARLWVDGYRDVTDVPYYNYGACIDCLNAQLDTVNGQIPQTAWSLEDYWYVSFYGVEAYSVPQIYLSNTNEMQWAMVKNWAASCSPQCLPWQLGYRYMYFSGALTEQQACNQAGRPHDATCQAQGNSQPTSPEQGWRLLITAANQVALRYSTDIKWGWDIP